MKSMHSVRQRDHKEGALNADDLPRDEATEALPEEEAVQLEQKDTEALRGKEDMEVLLKEEDMEILPAKEVQVGEEEVMSEAGQSNRLK